MATATIDSVKAYIEGIGEVTLTRVGSTNNWSASMTAPNWSSYNHDPNGLDYTVTAKANTTAETETDTRQIVMKETNAPVITITQLTNGSTTTEKKPVLKFNVTDNNGEIQTPFTEDSNRNGFSGINMDMLSIGMKHIENTTMFTDFEVTSTPIVTDGVTVGYSVTAKSNSEIPDGRVQVFISAEDYDENSGTNAECIFEVRTAKPTINIVSPSNGYATKNSTVTVTGTCKSQASTITNAYVCVNSGVETPITVSGPDASGNYTFTGNVTLSEGDNTIKVKVVDGDTLDNDQSITVYYSSKLPVISNVSIKNKADNGNYIIAGAEYTITCTVSI